MFKYHLHEFWFQRVNVSDTAVSIQHNANGRCNIKKSPFSSLILTCWAYDMLYAFA